MQTKDKKIIERIINASKNDTLSFFVGAGVSKISDAPTWAELIDKFCDELGVEKGNYTSDDFLSIPQKYYCTVDENTYYNFVNSCLDSSKLTTNIIHTLMCYLKPHSFITTNFDDLIEKAVIENCMTYKSIACDNEVSSINGDKYILKVHGDLVHQNIVLKEEDYLNYSENFKLIETLLKSIFSTNTVVFIGYSLNDYNIKLILNWAKRLLNESFNKPIFIYTDDSELKKIDLLYQSSRGLDVLDFRACTDEKGYIEFIDRYRNVLEKIISYSNINLKGKSKIESLSVLYELLNPLDDFKALTTSDIRKQLHPYLYITDDGIIRTTEKSYDILTYVYEVMSNASVLPSKSEQDKIDTIKRVFKKARLIGFEINKKLYRLDTEPDQFAEQKCIMFDYIGMEKFIRKSSNSIYDDYIKAYYLAQFRKYQEAIELYTNVAQKSFENENYLLCYLAQINRRVIGIITKNINFSFFYNEYFKLSHIEQMSIQQRIDEHIFDNMPLEFKIKYKNFSELYSVNYLYKNAYDSFIASEKLKATLNKNIIEMGFTAVDKVLHQINDNLHFILGNRLYLDSSTEFQSVVKNMMSLVVAKYSVIQQENLDKFLPMLHSAGNLVFDEVDIYCFISYFKESEIDDVMQQYKIEDLPLQNLEAIDISIYNLFNFYDKFLSKSSDTIMVLPYQHKMKSCIRLMKYITVSPKTIEFVCRILFKYEFREIYLDDKILFIDSQIYNKKIEAGQIKKYIIKSLIQYIDNHISALQKGEKFDPWIHRTGFDYWDLANYLSLGDKKYRSRNLSQRIEYIMDAELDINCASMFKCSEIIFKDTKEKLIKYMSNKLDEVFNFKIFATFISNKIKPVNNHIVELKNHLRNLLTQSQKEHNGIETYPPRDNLEDLVNVAYWCLLGELNTEDFKEFVGTNRKFDFFYNPDEFDYDNFDVSWLLHQRTLVYETLSNLEITKKEISNCIIKALKERNLAKNNKEELNKILLDYFI